MTLLNDQKNEYFKRAAEAHDPEWVGHKAWQQELSEEEVRSFTGSGYEFGLSEKRSRFCTAVGWSLVTKEWADDIAGIIGPRRVLEVCAGRLTVTRMMLRRGVDWIATDKEPVDDGVLKMKALTACRTLPHDIVFASWIPYESYLDWCLARQGKPVILIGEGFYGCTGHRRFWKKNGYKIYDMSDVVENFHDVPQWCGIHDHTQLVLPDGWTVTEFLNHRRA